jgi:hypothetical protein
LQRRYEEKLGCQPVIDDINHLKCEYDVDINNVVTYVVKSVRALPEISGTNWDDWTHCIQWNIIYT